MHAVSTHHQMKSLKKLARIDRITAIFSNVREHVRKGNTYVMVVYASPPLTGGETQRFAKAAHLCPVRVWRHLPSDTFHNFTVLSLDPLTSCDGSVGLNWTHLTYELPFSQMSDF
jgi:hypothetical protein